MPFSNKCNDPADRLSSVDMEWEQWEEELSADNTAESRGELFILPGGFEVVDEIFVGDSILQSAYDHFRVSYREVVA